MVIIFNKRTGEIRSIFSGDLQTLDIMYGNEAADYKQILDELLIDDDINIINNWRMFQVNVVTKQVQLIPSIVSQYPSS